MLKEWLYIAGLLMTIFIYLNTSQHNAVFLCWNKFMLLKNHYYISHVEVRRCKGLYTSHMYSSFCVELRSIPAGKPHVVYLAGVQVASRGTLNI